MHFDSCNHPLKIQKSIGIPIPKVGTHLGVWGFIPSTFLHSWEHEMRLLGSLLALALVASPKLGLQQKQTNIKDQILINIHLPAGLKCLLKMSYAIMRSSLG
jgi:hypothetical protein